MKTTVYCKPTDKGIHTFYLSASGKDYFLFHQDYRKGVHSYFEKGVSLNEAMDFSRAHRDNALIRTMEKLPMYIKYVEKEYGIAVYNKTVSRQKNYHERCRVA